MKRLGGSLDAAALTNFDKGTQHLQRRSGGAAERRSGGAAERRSGGAAERRSGGAALIVFSLPKLIEQKLSLFPSGHVAEHSESAHESHTPSDLVRLHQNRMIDPGAGRSPDSFNAATTRKDSLFPNRHTVTDPACHE
nr:MULTISPECIES: hypothetical protein [Burkholderia]